MERLSKVLSELPRKTLELLCVDFMTSLLVWQGKLTHEDQLLELLNQRLGKKTSSECAQERDKILKEALEGTTGFAEAGEAAAKHIRDRIKYGMADPEINAIREGVKKAIREGTKHLIGGFEQQMMEEEDREVKGMLDAAVSQEEANAAVRERLKEDERREIQRHVAGLTMTERLEKIDVICKHTGQILDVEFAAKDRVRWSCLCGHRLDLPNYVVDSIASHATTQPSVIFIDEHCRRKE